jgi:hypothetical protein
VVQSYCRVGTAHQLGFTQFISNKYLRPATYANIAVLIFTQMMISIIRFRTSIESIDQKSIKLMLVLSLNAIDKISVAIDLVKFLTNWLY